MNAGDDEPPKLPANAPTFATVSVSLNAGFDLQEGNLFEFLTSDSSEINGSFAQIVGIGDAANFYLEELLGPDYVGFWVEEL